MKKIRRIIVYALLVIGATVMISPFAWMVVTSLKLSTEVNTWPPTWSTKSFARSRDVKVVPTTGGVGTAKGLSLREALAFVAQRTQGLVLNVNDAPFYRGTLRIPLKGANYAPSVDEAEFRSFVESLRTPVEFEVSSPEVFFEEVYLYYLTGSKPFFKRDVFVESTLGSIDAAIQTINMTLTFGTARIDDENLRDRFESHLGALLQELELVKPKIERFKAGTELVLTLGEIRQIDEIFRNLQLQFSPETHEVVANLNQNLNRTVGAVVEHVGFFLKVSDYFGKVQIATVDRDLVARPLSTDERKRLLVDMSKVLKDGELVRRLVDTVHFDAIGEEFSKALDKSVEERYKVSGIDLATLKSLVGTLINLAYEYGLDPDEGLKRSFDDFERLLEGKVGFNLTFSSVRSKLNAYREEIPNADEALLEIARNTLELSTFRRIYENARYAWRIVSGPSFVKSVLVKDGKSVEIVTEGVGPVYFVDDGIRTVHLDFTASEVLRNVFQNYVLAWRAAPFGRYYANTVFISVTTTILELIVSAMAAYAFSWMNFPGKGILFSAFLATMMVPGEMLLVPNFITVTKFGWIDTYYALIVPWIVSVFSIFLMRQHFMSLPQELFDAARIDGSSHWRFLWQIVVPLSKPVVITTALLKFVGSWNAFLWVLIVTNSPKYRTLTVGLQTFSSEFGTLYNMLMAAATFSILPVVVIFLFTQKYFVRGIARTGLK